jgi:hypothetical protein
MEATQQSNLDASLKQLAAFKASLYTVTTLYLNAKPDGKGDTTLLRLFARN